MSRSMRRFVLILDAFCGLDDLTSLDSTEIAYELRINLALKQNEWITIDQPGPTNVAGSNSSLSPSDNASFLISHLASLTHSACSKLKQFLCNRSCFYSLELMWTFPVFDPQTSQSDDGLHEALLELYGAFERVAQCNHGHIHILCQQQSPPPSTANPSSHARDEEAIDLCDIHSWKEMLNDHCTIWNLSELAQSMQPTNALQVMQSIIKPSRLASVALHVNCQDQGSQRVMESRDMSTDTDHKQESVDMTSAENGAHKSKEFMHFGFDLIPCLLYESDTQKQVMKHSLLWRNWSTCCGWQSMSVLKVVQRSTFPQHWLLGDLYLMQHCQDQPVLFMVRGVDENSNALIRHWMMQTDTAWIVRFDESQHLQHGCHRKLYHHTDTLAENAFMSEDEFMQFHVQQHIENDDFSDCEHGDENNSQVVDNNSSHRSVRSHKYLLYPWQNTALMAHRIIDGDVDEEVPCTAAETGNADIVTDWIYCLLDLSTQPCPAPSSSSSSEASAELQDVYQQVIELPCLRYDPQSHEFVTTTHDDDETEKIQNERREQFKYLTLTTGNVTTADDQNPKNELLADYCRRLKAEHDRELPPHQEDQLSAAADMDMDTDASMATCTTNLDDRTQTQTQIPNTPSASVYNYNASATPIERLASYRSKPAKHSQRRSKNMSRKSNRGLAAVHAVADQYILQTPAGKRVQSDSSSNSNLGASSTRSNSMTHIGASKILQSAQLYRKQKSQRTKRAEPEQKQEREGHEQQEQAILHFENVLSVFDETGELRDKSKQQHLEQLSAEGNVLRKDWRLLQQRRDLSGNWPVQSRFYGAQSMEYKQKISRIKEQYLNCMQNAAHKKNTSFEIIGDLSIEEQKAHPITIIHKKQTNYRQKYKVMVSTLIGKLLKEEMGAFLATHKNVYKELKNKIYDRIWTRLKNDKGINIDQETDQIVLEEYVFKKFEGLFLAYSIDYDCFE